MSTFNRFKRLCIPALAICFTLAAAGVSAQASFPSKPVRLIVPATAGSAADLLARMLTERLTKPGAQPWVVENRPGAGGTIGADAVAKAAPDGHTLLFTANNFIIAPRLYPSIPYDIRRDFTPIGPVAVGHDMIFVNPSLNVKSLKELVALAKRTPGGLNYGAPFYGSSAHLIMESFARANGIELTFIAASGGPQSFGEAVAGRVPLVIGTASLGTGFVKAGRLSALTAVGFKRSSFLPEVPTLAEAGYPALNLPLWFGLYGPARMAPAAIDHVGRELAQVLGSSEFAEALVSRGFSPLAGSAADLLNLMRDGEPVFAKAITEAGIKPQ
jgi:tripartite-type tricarboxylate transporter receptor subunit TctC